MDAQITGGEPAKLPVKAKPKIDKKTKKFTKKPKEKKPIFDKGDFSLSDYPLGYRELLTPTTFSLNDHENTFGPTVTITLYAESLGDNINRLRNYFGEVIPFRIVQHEDR